MTPLSELLRGRSSFILPPPSPAEPARVRQAAERIRRRWPDVEIQPHDEDPEALASDMERRREADDWREFHWSDVMRTALAFFHSDLWQEPRFEPLFDFLLRQIGPDRESSGYRAYLRAMFRIYLATFESRSESTRRLAGIFSHENTWQATKLPIGALIHHPDIFDVDGAPGHIAAFMDTQDSPFHALRERGMEAPHGAGLMQAAHQQFVRRLTPRIANGDTDTVIEAVNKLLDWLRPPDENPLQGGAGPAIDALLLPWSKRDTPEDLKETIKTRLVDAYGDPRLSLAGAWSACDPLARKVILKWMVGATIRIFFEIVSQAEPSHMWPERREFWTGLYEEDRITEAWFDLSDTGAARARQLACHREDPSLESFARNTSRSAQDRRKCLLLMKIDERWVIEGSNSFKVHIFPSDDSTSVIPYEDSYTCEQFRDIAGPNEPQRIVHLGDWRNRVLTALLQ